MVACLSADDLLFAESEEDFQRMGNEFYSVCMRRKLKVNTGKSKVMAFERTEVEVDDFSTPYRESANSWKV